jgi:hypothetical protein
LDTSISLLSENKPFVYIQEGDFVIENAPEGSRAQIYNFMGQLVRSISIASNREIVSGNYLTENVYIVKLNGKNFTSLHKIIKK